MEEEVIVKTPTKKGKLLFYFILFFIYLVGVGIVLVNKPQEKKQLELSSYPAATITPMVDSKIFQFDPPSQALVGTLNITSRTVEKYARFADDWEEIASPSSILQDEKIQTDKSGNAEVEFTNQLSLSINPDSEIYFANLLPDSFLVEQSKGEVTYTVEKPISIKSVDTLTSFGQGKLILEIDPDNGFIYLNIASGSGKFSFIDNDNQTQVYEIEKGDRVTYNPENTTISIR